ncbi:MAG: hypothetical protein Q7W13_16375 [Bacteroidia bacterium]|nr:hypothetical protein [Bacteroidia bacterium]
MKTKTKQCEYCSKEFEAVRSDQKYCAPNCKQNAYNERLRGQNENVRDKEQSQQAEFHTNRLLLPVEYSAEQKSMDKQAEILPNEREERLAIDEFLKQLENDTIKRKTDSANKILKNWLQRLLEFDEEKEVPLYKARSLYEDIVRSTSYALYGISKDYKYLPFINNLLIPKVENLHKAIKHSRERHTTLNISSDLKRKFMDILSEID